MEDAAELLFAGYFLAFCVVVGAGLWGQAWFVIPEWAAVHVHRRRLGRDVRRVWIAAQRSWRNFQQYFNE